MERPDFDRGGIPRPAKMPDIKRARLENSANRRSKLAANTEDSASTEELSQLVLAA